MDKMRLEVEIRLQPLGPDGYPSSNGMQLREQYVITTGNFMAAAKVLGQFHDLAEALGDREGDR